MRKVCRFTFKGGTTRDAVESQLTLAIVVAECMFGHARVRPDAAYLMSEDGKQLAIDASNEVGEYIAQLFTGLLIREVGENRFTVERIKRGDEVAQGAQAGA